MASKYLSIDLKEENKQGISSILGLSLDCRREKRGKTEYPLRRTLSADMSSKRFLSQSSLKKVASSEEISTISQESGDNTMRRPSQSDVWSSIQSQKLNQSESLNPPYVHPLTRRSSSSLSSKSLEMCTESLGSETGSDVCSIENSPPWLTLSPPSSPPHPLPSDEDVHTEEHHHEERNFFKFERKQLHTEKSVNYNCTISRRSPPRSFPPPLPSLSRRDGGPCLHMKPRRQEGRLVLEAVAAPSHNYLHAERQGGRLLLSFISTGEEEDNSSKITSTEKEEEMDQVVEVEGDHEIVHDEDRDVNDQQEVRTEKDLGLVERGLEVLSIEKWKNSASPPPVMELHRSIAKLIAQPFVNLNPWTPKKKKIEFEEENDSSSILSRVNGLSGGCFNVYECSWKEAVGEVVVGKEELGKPSLPLSQHLGGVLAASAAASPPSSRCHSLPRRTQHLWILERYCIATT